MHKAPLGMEKHLQQAAIDPGRVPSACCVRAVAMMTNRSGRHRRRSCAAGRHTSRLVEVTVCLEDVPKGCNGLDSKDTSALSADLA